MITDSAFTSIAHAIAFEHNEIPISLYRFNQEDPFQASLLKGRAFHSPGNSMLFRQPTVVGPNADEGTRATSDKFCEAAIMLTHGQQPWESYNNSKKVMVFDGSKSGMLEIDGKDRWADLTKTRERLHLFKSSGTILIQEEIKAANTSSASCKS